MRDAAYGLQRINVSAALPCHPPVAGNGGLVMSLERLHAVVIAACVLVSSMVGLWALGNAEWLLGFAALVGGAALTVNSGYLLRSKTEEPELVTESLPGAKTLHLNHGARLS